MTQSSGFESWLQVETALKRAVRKLRRSGDMVAIYTSGGRNMSIGSESGGLMPSGFRCTAHGDSALKDLTPKDGRYEAGGLMPRLGGDDYQSDRVPAPDAISWMTELARAWRLDASSVRIELMSLDKSSPFYKSLGS